MRALFIAVCPIGPASMVAFVRCAKAYTDGSTMGTSKGVEATSFSEQVPASAPRLFRRL
jgi:hypothetical protein